MPGQCIKGPFDKDHLSITIFLLPEMCLTMIDSIFNQHTLYDVTLYTGRWFLPVNFFSYRLFLNKIFPFIGCSKLRARLGLKPLDAPTNSKEESMKKEDDDVHAPPINIGQVKRTEELREKVHQLKEKRRLQSKMG